LRDPAQETARRHQNDRPRSTCQIGAGRCRRSPPLTSRDTIPQTAPGAHAWPRPILERANRKPMSNKHREILAVIAELSRRFPLVFVANVWEAHKPLAIGIGPAVIAACPDLPLQPLRQALAMYARRLAYRKAVAGGRHARQSRRRGRGRGVARPDGGIPARGSRRPTASGPNKGPKPWRLGRCSARKRSLASRRLAKRSAKRQGRPKPPNRRRHGYRSPIYALPL
jgi:hypothetical protein